jgi:hypothetical protein
VGKPEGKKPIGRPRYMWMDNTKMDLRKIRRGGADWIDFADDCDRLRALTNTVLKLLCHKMKEIA